MANPYAAAWAAEDSFQKATNPTSAIKTTGDTGPQKPYNEPTPTKDVPAPTPVKSEPTPAPGKTPNQPQVGGRLPVQPPVINPKPTGDKDPTVTLPNPNNPTPKPTGDKDPTVILPNPGNPNPSNPKPTGGDKEPTVILPENPNVPSTGNQGKSWTNRDLPAQRVYPSDPSQLPDSLIPDQVRSGKMDWNQWVNLMQRNPSAPWNIAFEEWQSQQAQQEKPMPTGRLPTKPPTINGKTETEWIQGSSHVFEPIAGVPGVVANGDMSMDDWQKILRGELTYEDWERRQQEPAMPTGRLPVQPPTVGGKPITGTESYTHTEEPIGGGESITHTREPIVGTPGPVANGDMSQEDWNRIRNGEMSYEDWLRNFNQTQVYQLYGPGGSTANTGKFVGTLGRGLLNPVILPPKIVNSVAELPSYQRAYEEARRIYEQQNPPGTTPNPESIPQNASYIRNNLDAGMSGSDWQAIRDGNATYDEWQISRQFRGLSDDAMRQMLASGRITQEQYNAWLKFRR